MKKIALPLLLLSLAAGCGTIEAYHGPTLPSDQTAIVAPSAAAAWNPVHWGQRVVKPIVNGFSLGFWDSKFSVRTGATDVQVLVAQTGWGKRWSEPIYLNFYTEPGHVYAVCGKNDGVGPFGIGGRPEAWIIDRNTNLVVAASNPTRQWNHNEKVKKTMAARRTRAQEYASFEQKSKPPVRRREELPKKAVLPKTASRTTSVQPSSHETKDLKKLWTDSPGW